MTKQELTQQKEKVDVTRVDRNRLQPTHSPLVDIVENPDGLVLSADVPGAGKDGLDIQVEGNVLTVEARITPHDPEGGEPIYREYDTGSYVRSFILSDELDSAKICAELDDGVLTLVLPKAEAARPRKIEVQAN